MAIAPPVPPPLPPPSTIPPPIEPPPLFGGASTARARITSDPIGATVTLDDSLVGITPYVADLEPGEHRLRLSYPGFRAHDATISIAPGGGEVNLSYSLDPLPPPTLPGVPHPPPPPDMPEPEVRGSTLDVIRAHRDELRACALHVQWQTTFTVRIHAGDDGRVTNVAIDDADVPGSAASCVRDRIQLWRFPSGRGETSVTLPVSLEPTY
jgi:hypothetical protein